MLIATASSAIKLKGRRMNSNLKTLGVAFVVALAIVAIFAAGAKAIKVTSAASPVWSTGSVIEHPAIGLRHTFTTSGGQVLSCETATFTSTEKNGDTSSIIIPTLNKCSAKIGAETLLVTVTFNDCDYLMHGGKEVSSTTFSEGEVDLVCPSGKVLEIHIYKSATSEAEELCTYKVAPFVNKVANEFHNVAGSPNEVTVTSTLTGMAVTRTGSLVCGAANMTATYTGSTTLKAYEDVGGSVSEGTVSGLKEASQVGLTASS